jgi:hypothetical protein
MVQGRTGMDGGSPGGKETSIKKEETMIEKLFTYIYIALAIYFSAAFIYTKEEMALLVSLWCWTMVEIRTMKIPKIYIGIEKEQKQEERKDDT